MDQKVLKTEAVRVQKFCSDAGICSRRTAEEWIRARRLTLNGRVVTLGDKMTENDVLLFDKKLLKKNGDKKTKVLAFYKPRKIEVTMSAQEDTKTLLDFDFGTERVFPIGRLDKDSEGLLLLTNDGVLGNRVAHPSFGKEKEYLVFMNKEFDHNFLRAMEKGVKIDRRVTAPCKIFRIEPKIFRIILSEGRNRQIRKMCEVLGYKVLRLMRIRIAHIKLGEMKPGKWRILSTTELWGFDR